jgi:DNA-binding NtrC family response regulator
MSRRSILVVDDDPGVVDYLVESLGAAGYAATGTVSAMHALERVRAQRFDLVLSDVEMPEMRGVDLLHAIHALRPAQLVMLITAFGNVELAVRAVREGACDFITKPFKIEALLYALDRAFQDREMRREIVRLRSHAESAAEVDLVARSPSMQRLVQLARRVAQNKATVLLTGESGVGKGALARFIHEHSAVKSGPLVQVNCAALPAQLVEAELFGARKGAFTDAREDRHGLFFEANNGTLMLDEIGEMPLDAQPKLLHALETGHVRPVGASREVAVNVRLVAATNVSLAEAVQDKRFRADLFYRLNVVSLEVPPLRDRHEDIVPLADLFLHRANQKLARDVLGISTEATRWLLAHAWPGNVRELANTLERAVAVTGHDTIVLEDLRAAEAVTQGQDFLADAVARGLPLADVERSYISRVLGAMGGNKVKAARVLGIDRRTLHRKLGTPEPGDG